MATSFDYGQYKDDVENAVEDAVKFYCSNMNKEESKRSKYAAELEFLTLSRLYSKMGAENKHYNWHIVVSQIHTPKEKHLHALHTNHKNILNCLSPVEGIAKLPSALKNSGLNFYSNFEVTMDIPDGKGQPKEKRVEIIVLN